MMSLNPYRLRHQRKKSSGARRAANHYCLMPPKFIIGLILIGNNAVNILAAIIANMLAIYYVGEAAALGGNCLSDHHCPIFSEVTPKTIAAQNPEWFAFKASHILKPLLHILTPLVWLINRLTNRFISLLGFDPKKDRDDSLDTEELKSLVDISGHKISDSNQGMLRGILDLENITVEDIMIPRNEVMGLDLEDNIDNLMDQILSCEYESAARL